MQSRLRTCKGENNESKFFYSFLKIMSHIFFTICTITWSTISIQQITQLHKNKTFYDSIFKIYTCHLHPMKFVYKSRKNKAVKMWLFWVLLMHHDICVLWAGAGDTWGGQRFSGFRSSVFAGFLYHPFKTHQATKYAERYVECLTIVAHSNSILHFCIFRTLGSQTIKHFAHNYVILNTSIVAANSAELCTFVIYFFI